MCSHEGNREKKSASNKVLGKNSSFTSIIFFALHFSSVRGFLSFELRNLLRIPEDCESALILEVSHMQALSNRGGGKR